MWGLVSYSNAKKRNIINIHARNQFKIHKL